MVRLDSTLQAADQIIDILGQSIWIFPGSLLSASPARVSEWIDVRGPEVEARPVCITKRAAFCANDRGYGMDEIVVERRRSENGLRE